MASISDEQTASCIAREVRELRDQAEEFGSSTYIPAYITEYLDDTAGIIRRLHACQGDRAAATKAIAQTLQWREDNKVYPTRRGGSQSLVVDEQGFIVVRGRQASLLPRAGGRQRTVAKGQCAWRYFERSIETLEDARMALKAAYAQTKTVSQAAVVVPVESVRLAELTTDGIQSVVCIANSHYPGAIGRVYVTAKSSVLLEHARQSLQPMLGRLAGCGKQDLVQFLLDAELPTLNLADFTLRMHARAPSLAYLPLKRRLDGLVRRAASIYSGEADTDTDEFHSAYSDVYSRTHVAPDRLSEKSALDNRSQKSAPSNVSRKSASSYISGSSALSNLSEKSAVLPVQLASLQRAVQSVQSMLRSINDSIVSDDSRMALAATKSKLAQQADVLMSTVAALNVGVSMLGSRAGSGEPSPRRAFVVTAKEPADGTGGLLRLLALPMALLFGRPRDALRVLSSLLARAVRIVVRRLRRLPAFQTLLLLAYKHTRIYAMVFWTGALLVWQANAAVIWANLSSSWQRGISF